MYGCIPGATQQLRSSSPKHFAFCPWDRAKGLVLGKASSKRRAGRLFLSGLLGGSSGGASHGPWGGMAFAGQTCGAMKRQIAPTDGSPTLRVM